LSNILIIHSGLTGISNACLEISNRLKKDGHQVYTASMNDDTAITQTVDYLEIQSITFDYNAFKTKYSNHSKGTQSNNEQYFNLLIKKLNFSAFDELLKVKQINLILIDMELHEYILYLFSKQLPFILICQWFSIWQTENNLPPSSKHVPKSKMQLQVIWRYHALMGSIKTIANAIKSKGFNRRNFILYLKKQLNIKEQFLISHQFPLPYSYTNLPTISTTHPNLEFANTSVANLNYAYPMVYENRVELVTETFALDFEKMSMIIKNENKKLIVVTRSSMNKSNRKIIPNILNALVELKDCISIVSIGKWFDEFKAYNKHPNVFVYKSIPQIKSLKQAHLSINHGGIHTINECIHFKVPMLILSGNKFDQNGCAARVHKYGCGLAYFGDNIDRVKMIALIYKLLQENSYRKKIEQLNESYIQAKKKGVLENYINDFLKSSAI